MSCRIFFPETYAQAKAGTAWARELEKRTGGRVKVDAFPGVIFIVSPVSGVARDVPLEMIFRGVFPFVIALIGGAPLLVVFPQLAPWLPGLVG